MPNVLLNLLLDARRRIQRRWIKGSLYTNGWDGTEVEGVCMIGAINRAIQNNRELTPEEKKKARTCLVNLVAEEVKPWTKETPPKASRQGTIISFNDQHGTKKVEVVKRFDAAIEKLKTCQEANGDDRIQDSRQELPVPPKRDPVE